MEIPVPELLSRVEKPSRYLGIEINSVHKAREETFLTVALVFPDLYEVGMSHLGLHILYGLGNQLDGVQVERVFLPGQDMLELLRRKGLPLFTLESRTPLNECGLVGVTLQSELTYTNVLTVLDASGIPLCAHERMEEHPIVMGGGPCAFNPEPMWEFFDLFYLGDGEESWPETLRVLSRATEKNLSREEKIRVLKKIPGIYDPRDFLTRYSKDGRIKEILNTAEPSTVLRGFTKTLDRHYPPASFIVPFLAPVHDRINIEATRGCTRGCRFCHAGMVYRPVRERTAKSVLEMAREALSITGHSDLALTSLSIGDYSSLDEVLESLMDHYEEERVSISLPSMRIGGLTPSVARQILRVRRTGFTIAPEAGTERLRRVINKDFTDEEIMQTTRWVFDHGWDSIKFYFMIGLPTETEEDLEAIDALVKKVVSETRSRVRVTVNLSPFVPKPHTPFQWVAQMPEHELRGRLDFLKERLRGQKIQVKWGRTDQALLEAILARGDRRLSAVIRAAWDGGAVMDGWDEHFNWDYWQEAFRKIGLDPESYAGRVRDEEEIMPWDHIPCGVEKGFLLNEYRKGLSGQITQDCREAGCLACKACPPSRDKTIPVLRNADVSGDVVETLEQGTAEAEKSVRRIRLVFSKIGDMRFIGHLETVRAIERACRRAGIPLAFSGGFSPKPKITFALSLPAGVEGSNELMDLELSESLSAVEVLERINRHLPEGLLFLRAWKVPVEGGALNGRVRYMTYRALLPEHLEDLGDLVSRFEKMESLPILRVRKGKEKTVDLKHYLVSIRAEDDQSLLFTLALKGDEGSARPAEVLQTLFGLDEDSLVDIKLIRTSLTLDLDADRTLSRAGMARIWD
jgi:radical SAM family uncharacterized protein/radical SAM-linked protein